jgi:thiol-disulfide isomerase/thioredoxin
MRLSPLRFVTINNSIGRPTPTQKKKQMIKNVALIIALAIAAAAGYFAYVRSVEPTVPQASTVPSSAALEFILPDLSGQPRKFSEWQGKARIVNFWATWCAPCRREIPLLKQTQTAQAANNLQIIGIAVDFPEDVAAYAEEAQFNYPILVGQEEAMAAAEASGVEFIGMPFTLIVSPDGELLNAHMGEIVASHIEIIVGVFNDLKAGTLTVDAARAELADM